MSDNTPTLPIREDGVPSEASEAEMLARVMEQSTLVNNYDENSEPVPEPEDEVLEDEEEAEEAEIEEEIEEDEEESEELEDEEVEEEAEYLAQDDLDMEAMVEIIVDGEQQLVPMGDLVKNYQTDSHIGKKGRELGEERKAFEEQAQAKLGELENMIATAGANLMQNENALAEEYHKLAEKLGELDEDDYDYDKLERQVDRKQKEYWKARNAREGMVDTVTKQRQAEQQNQWEAEVKNFYDTVTDHIPEWTEEYNEDIRKFAVEEGVPEQYLATMTDPAVVKIVDDYRKLKMGVTEGKAKRKKAPVKKAMPTKKAAPAAKKKAAEKDNLRSKVLSGEGSRKDDLDFLKSISNSEIVR